MRLRVRPLLVFFGESHRKVIQGVQRQQRCGFHGGGSKLALQVLQRFPFAGMLACPHRPIDVRYQPVERGRFSVLRRRRTREPGVASLYDFQKCFIDCTAVEANTERPTDSTILVKLIARVCTTAGNLHRLDLPDMNQIGLLEQQEEFRRMSHQIHFLNGKARGEAKRKKLYFQLSRRARRLRKRLLRSPARPGSPFICPPFGSQSHGSLSLKVSFSARMFSGFGCHSGNPTEASFLLVVAVWL